MNNIPNHIIDIYNAYKSFHPKYNKNVYHFYNKNKNKIHNYGMTNKEICEVLNISSGVLQRTLDSAIFKIKYHKNSNKILEFLYN